MARVPTAAFDLDQLSRDLDGVLQSGWNLLGERHHEVPVEGRGDPSKGVDPVARAAALLIDPPSKGLPNQRKVVAKWALVP